jgi:hypothetical protein
VTLSRRSLLTSLGLALPAAVAATAAEAATKLHHHRKHIHKTKLTRTPHKAHLKPATPAAS